MLSGLSPQPEVFSMKRSLAAVASFSLSMLGCGGPAEADPEAVEASTASLIATTQAECLSRPLCSDYANQACNPVGSVLECCRVYYPDYYLDYLVCTGSGRTGHWLYE
jgi:hypothetical protein